IPPLACFKIDMIWLSLCFDIVIYSISSFVARKFYSFWQLFLGKITLSFPRKRESSSFLCHPVIYLRDLEKILILLVFFIIF
ncbi:MAG: hypothetical protein ACRCRR_04295, partial [Rickettsia sp.]